MEFNTIHYVVFLLCAVIVYYAACRTYPAQRMLIIVASAFFYAVWSSAFLIHVMLVIAINYALSLILLRARDMRAKRRVLILAICLDVANLFFFKYFNLAITTANWFVTAFGASRTFPLAAIILPLAISFYTFSMISYLVDVYRDPANRARSLAEFALYALFFPHLIAGPILRKDEFFPQCGYKTLDSSNIRAGVERVLLGLFFKAVIADNLAIGVDYAFKHCAEITPGEMYIGLVCYAFQIFFDFAGYSSIAIGSARMFGYRFPENFNTPYIADSIADFWRRWHMTLSRWIRDYIYIPLGGSHGSGFFATRNLIVTMGVGGLWHGASWNFAVWGIYHGVGLAAHREYAASRMRAAIAAALGPVAYRLVAIVVTFQFVLFGWILFRAPDFGVALTVAGKVLRAMTGEGWHVDSIFLWKTYGILAMMLYGVFLALCHIPALAASVQGSLRRRVYLYAITGLLVVLLAPLHSDPFIYFQF